MNRKLVSNFRQKIYIIAECLIFYSTPELTMFNSSEAQ